MQHFNLLEASGLPQKKRLRRETQVTEEDKKIALRLDESFYDGTRDKGYGGYSYDGRWKRVAEVIRERYKLNSDSKVLIDRCHKGFLVYDLMELIPGIIVYGIMSNEYPINHAMDGYGEFVLELLDHKSAFCSYGSDQIDLKKWQNLVQELQLKAREKVLPYLLKCDSFEIPFKDNYFDSVISIENACAYSPGQCEKVIREITRVSKNNGCDYIQNDSWENEDQKKSLLNWTFLCKTFLAINEYEEMYKKMGYNGDYGFTIIE